MTEWHTKPHRGLHDDVPEEEPSGMYNTDEMAALSGGAEPLSKGAKLSLLEINERALMESVRRQVEDRQREENGQ